MATELVMPALIDQRGPFYAPQRPDFGHTRSQSFQTAPRPYGQRVSPLSTPHDGSPTSPKSCLNESVRPIYMPAVLRPTQHHSKMPRTPKAEDMDGEDLLCLRRSNSSFISLPGFSVIGQKLSRRSTGDSGKVIDLDLDPDLFPEVTGEPTRKHWKPDTESTMCDDPTCKRNFNTFTRRHHCRRCGNIFCGPHSANVIPLDEGCNYNPRGALSRACFHCFTEFKVWKSRNGSRSGSDQSSDSHSSSTTTPTSPIVASPVAPSTPGLLPPTKGPEVAASVPRDWNWSTF
ncbi:FYVE domain-containing protein [Colletotrichum truncatum]|uniref:FYVE domain-containing protein n=1 Tax=Colletotrichum truncatum TaxID=5467 RepID=A0ACC3YG28_COLTU|nr:FYVE domain-containing protein [Colletotrichum truncatum]KAF6784470.1 FYVE domain-containing protein [Colletotrichum truncatum]